MKYRGKKRNYQMSSQECIRGWIFLFLFVLVLPFLMSGARWALDRQWQILLPDTTAALAYYYMAIALVFLLFWHYLKNSYHLLLDRMPENLFGFVSGAAIFLVLYQLVMLVPLPVENPVWSDYAGQYLLAPGATVVIVVVLMPIVEEVLFRGVAYDTVAAYSRPLAWACTLLLTGFYSVWQYVFVNSDPRYLLLSLQFIPSAVASTWCYSRGGSIWSAIALHMGIHGMLLYGAVA